MAVVPLCEEPPFLRRLWQHSIKTQKWGFPAKQPQNSSKAMAGPQLETRSPYIPRETMGVEYKAISPLLWACLTKTRGGGTPLLLQALLTPSHLSLHESRRPHKFPRNFTPNNNRLWRGKIKNCFLSRKRQKAATSGHCPDDNPSAQQFRCWGNLCFQNVILCVANGRSRAQTTSKLGNKVEHQSYEVDHYKGKL